MTERLHLRRTFRRVAAVARIWYSGLAAICSFTTPLQARRAMIRRIIGPADFVDIYGEASFSTLRPA